MRPYAEALSAAFLLATFILGGNTNAQGVDSSLSYRPKNSPQVKGYFPSWNADSQPPSKIDWSSYTDVLYFTMIPHANFTLAYDPIYTWAQGEQLVKEFVAQARKNRVNPHFSAGGWTGSRHFSILTRTDASRKRFAKLLVDFGKRHSFSGIEMDWEYANGQGIGCNTKDPADVVNFGLLVKEIRALWPNVMITAALSLNGFIGADGKPATTKETALLAQHLDYVNLMAYDVYGPWAPTTGPLAPLHATCAPPAYAQSVETGVQIALKQGFKPLQIILGIPGYAKRLQLASPKLVPTKTNGQWSYYYQNHTGQTPPGGQHDDKPGVDICGNQQHWGGSFRVNELISQGWLSADEKTGHGGYTRHWDACSGQPFLTDGKYFITYDDQYSSVAKAQYAKQNKLGGIYFFDTMGPTSRTVAAAGEVIRK
ncbi:hypothetical protein PCASD_16746 [Puccinia coronata f. sp. avenae]|uniref:GH18 domain-containing protein n=1 Tax=Puccinia coronata f. sp. avenae TaxID=200324 RepID=A0A2N5TVX4_9BASI|nr:hypothetical protein PCASD_16746 [Puccinia coronata f. sp. avenae]